MMKWEIIKCYLTSPIQTYRDQKQLKKAAIEKITKSLQQSNEEEVSRGFPVMNMKDLKQSAKQIYRNRQQTRPSKETVQTLKDLQLGRSIRAAREAKQKHHKQEGYER